MVVRVNGTQREIPDGSTIEKLMEYFHLQKKSVVFELNHKVISRETYSLTKLKEDDILQIVHFVGGG